MRFSTTLCVLTALSSVPALAAQPVIVGPYPTLTTVYYDVDYAVSGTSQLGVKSDTIISIGLPSSVNVTGCQAQVQWFDWNGALAGLSGPSSPTAAIPTLAPGQTLEFTSSPTAVPGEYPDFVENVFRDTKTSFEGYAQIRVACSNGATLRGLRVDAEFVTQTPVGAGVPPLISSKTINVTKPAGLVGY